MGYYLFILVSVAMFGAGFGLQDLYRKRRGSGIRMSMESACIDGGTMIVSTIISFFGEKKPSLREIISVVLAFSGMLALFLIPA
jgi:hypothetical protein